MEGPARDCSDATSAKTPRAMMPASACCAKRSTSCVSAKRRSDPYSPLPWRERGIYLDSLENPVAGAPVQQQVGPGGVGFAYCSADAIAMAAGLKDMDLGGDPRGAQGGEIGHAIGHRRD